MKELLHELQSQVSVLQNLWKPISYKHLLSDCFRHCINNIQHPRPYYKTWKSRRTQSGPAAFPLLSFSPLRSAASDSIPS